MAEECTDSSVATSSSPPPNWWDLHASSSLSCWTNPNPTWHQPNPNSNSSCEEDVSISTSFTNASIHSGRRLHASSHDLLMAKAASDNHIWSQVLLGVGSMNGELHNSQGVGENLLNSLSSKSLSTAMFEPACDYLKQLENWELTNSPSFNGLSESLMDSKRLTKLSNLVGNWSIAPPNPEINRHLEPQPCNISLSSSMDHHQYSQHTFSDTTNRGINNGTNNYRNNMSSGLSPSYGGIGTNYSDHLKLEDDDHWENMEGAPIRRRSPFNANGTEHQIGINNSKVGDGNKCYYGIQNSPRNFADVISFSSRLGKPSFIYNIHTPKPSSKALNLSDNFKKQPLQTSLQTRINGRRGQGINEGKKKRSSQDNLETALKKTKQENSSSSSSTVSSTTKLQVPKVKLADRITTLQQIVSPFGKTDTASVLYEAIGYIKFLQEQVQLLSNPYMKTNAQKCQDPWGGMDRKEKVDARHDLRSRGLCLVPISCTPQVYRENTGSDYWTPAYQGCLYR